MDEQQGEIMLLEVESLAINFALQAKYGFVAFSDPEDFLKAWKEMDGEPS